nr:hypothetical protein [Tanacetum cinerariifolium]
MSPSSSHATITYTLVSDFESIKDDPQEVEEDLEEEPSKEVDVKELPASAASTSAIADHSSPFEQTNPFEEDEIPSPPLTSSPIHRDTIPEVDMLPQKRVRLSSSPYRFLVGESLAPAAETNKKVIDLYTGYRQDSREIYVRLKDAQDDKRFSMDKIRELQHQRQDDSDRVTRVIGHVRELKHARELERQNGPPDTDIGLAHCFEKMESVFHINNFTIECQVKYATCTLVGGVLTWWNSYVRTVRNDVAYGMPCKILMKMMTKAYCPRSEIKKLETETVPNETDIVERCVGGLLDNIQGSVMASKPKILQEAIEFVKSLMEKKVLVYAARQADNKRRIDNNPRNNPVE